MHALGIEPMPAQQLIWDVGLEIDPETGLPAYREVITTKPRQMGKTVVILGVGLDRALMWSTPQRIAYTAQTGSDARKKLLDEPDGQVPLLKRSKLWPLVARVHSAQGNESILFRNGSRIAVAASSREAGHGFTLDLGIIDECWADVDDRREQAMVPAMNTRPSAQLWVISTVGTEASVYLNRKMELGRAAVAAGRDSGIAYFEWGIPEDEDIEDPEVWWRYLPALGWTIQPNVIQHALETMDEAEFRRAYCNQRVRIDRAQVIPAILWEAVQSDSAEVNRERALAFGVDVHPDRLSAAIAASDGQVCELIEHRDGVSWLLERAQSLAERWGGRFVIEANGPAVSIADDMERAGLAVRRLTSSEMSAACARFYDAVADNTVTIRRAQVLDAAVEGLAKRPVGDRFVWDRRVSRADITPLVAVTLALGASPDRELLPLMVMT